MTVRQRKFIRWVYFLAMLVFNIVCLWKYIFPRLALFLEIFIIIKNIDKFLTALTNFGPSGILVMAVRKLGINKWLGSSLQLSQRQQLLSSFLNYMTLFTIILVVLPPIANKFNEMGMASMDKRRVSEAIPCFQIASKLDLTIADFHFNLGNAYTLLGSHGKDAIEEYKAAIRLDSDFAAAYNNLGYLYRKQGSCKDAVEQLLRAYETLAAIAL